MEARSFSNGITLSEITDLILEDNQCTGKRIYIIFIFCNLNFLNLVQLVQCGNFRRLNCDFFAVEQNFFKNFPKLQILNLNSFGLTEVPDLAMNTNLLELQMKNNSIMTIAAEKLLGNPPDYSRLLGLTVLDVANNKLKSVDQQLLKSMRNLKSLNLASNDLTSFPLLSLSESSSLEYLDLKSNEIETLLDWGVVGRMNLQIDITGKLSNTLTTATCAIEKLFCPNFMSIFD